MEPLDTLASRYMHALGALGARRATARGRAHAPPSVLVELLSIEAQPGFARTRPGRLLGLAGLDDVQRWMVRASLSRGLAAIAGGAGGEGTAAGADGARLLPRDVVAWSEGRAGTALDVARAMSHCSGALRWFDCADGSFAVAPLLVRHALGWPLDADAITVFSAARAPHAALEVIAESLALALPATASNGGLWRAYCRDWSFAVEVARGVAHCRGRGLLAYAGDPVSTRPPEAAAVVLVGQLEGLDVVMRACGDSDLGLEPIEPLDVSAPPGVLVAQVIAREEGHAFLRGHEPDGPTPLGIPLDPLRERVLRAHVAPLLPQALLGCELAWDDAERLERWGPAIAAALDGCAPSSLAGVGASRRRGTELPSGEVPRVSLDDLVANDDLARRLRAISGAAGRGERAVVLLHGPPGTGKSFAAKCLAGSLQRPLVTLDPGATRGMYYGEMERAVAAFFQAGQGGKAVLVIDECDEWMSVRQGSANGIGGARVTEVSSLLLQLERYGGVIVLTTNRASILDPAVARRVDHWVEVAMPDPTSRMLLWSSALGDQLQLNATELLLLAAVNLSGGDIAAVVREVGATGLDAHALFRAARRRSEQARLC